MTPPEGLVPLAAFAGVATYARLPYSTSLDDLDVAVIGVPFDGTVTYRSGARHGPRGIRAVSGLVGGYNPVQRVAPFQVLRCADVGDSPVVPGNTERTHDQITRSISAILDAKVTPLIFGGDHSCSLASLRAYASRAPVAVVHFDAHTDCADEYFGERFGHGSWLRRAIEEGLADASSSIQLGIRGSCDGPETYDSARDELGLELITCDEARADLGDTGRRLRERVGDRPVYISVDLDVIDPAFAPGVGTPEPGGLTSHEVLELIRSIGPRDLVGADIMEMLPSHDPAETTALLAANLGYELLCLLARFRSSSSAVGNA